MELLNTNTPCDSFPSYTVKVYTPVSVLPYNNIKVYALIYGLTKDNTWAYFPWQFTKNAHAWTKTYPNTNVKNENIQIKAKKYTETIST